MTIDRRRKTRLDRVIALRAGEDLNRDQITRAAKADPAAGIQIGIDRVGGLGRDIHAVDAGATLPEARTLAVNAFVAMEIGYLFNCRSLHRSVLSVGLFSNKWIWVGIGVTVGLQALFTYAPFMQALFDSRGLSLHQLLVCAGIGVTVLVVLELLPVLVVLVMLPLMLLAMLARWGMAAAFVGNGIGGVRHECEADVEQRCTSGACPPLCGTEYGLPGVFNPMGGIPGAERIPLHPRCRCYYSPERCY